MPIESNVASWDDAAARAGVGVDLMGDLGSSVGVNEPIRFRVEMRVRERDNTLEPATVRFSIRQESASGKGYERLGIVTVDLTDWVAEAGPRSRRFLLQESKMNSTLKLTIGLQQVEGDTSWTPSLTSRRIAGGLSNLAVNNSDSAFAMSDDGGLSAPGAMSPKYVSSDDHLGRRSRSAAAAVAAANGGGEDGSGGSGDGASSAGGQARGGGGGVRPLSGSSVGSRNGPGMNSYGRAAGAVLLGEEGRRSLRDKMKNRASIGMAFAPLSSPIDESRPDVEDVIGAVFESAGAILGTDLSPGSTGSSSTGNNSGSAKFGQVPSLSITQATATATATATAD